MESKEVEETREEISDAKTYHRILSCPLVKKEEKAEKSRYEKPSLDISLPHVSSLFLNSLILNISSFLNPEYNAYTAMLKNQEYNAYALKYSKNIR